MTDWIVGAWLITLPLLVAFVMGANILAISIIQTSSLRSLWAVAGCVLPLAATLGMFLTIQSAFIRLPIDS